MLRFLTCLFLLSFFLNQASSQTRRTHLNASILPRLPIAANSDSLLVLNPLPRYYNRAESEIISSARSINPKTDSFVVVSISDSNIVNYTSEAIPKAEQAKLKAKADSIQTNYYYSFNQVYQQLYNLPQNMRIIQAEVWMLGKGCDPVVIDYIHGRTDVHELLIGQSHLYFQHIIARDQNGNLFNIPSFYYRRYNGNYYLHK
ncbi:MAG: hypothetical protein MK212_02125 [Saprospiraceae bacterium]|nr:hypothetical protein [Saprospiraceae bacterium]